MELITQFFKDLGGAKLAGIILASLLFMAGGTLFILKVSKQDMVILFSNLDLEDSNQIVSQLEGQNIQYELNAGGSIVKVPENMVLRLRMNMAQAGIPSKGNIVGYEIFDHSEGLGSSNFVQNVNLIRALEGELGRTIASFEPIDKARVHLVIPKKEIFSREKQNPRASVVLKMKNNKELKKTEINAIAHLVTTAVPDLDINQITIVDTKGRSLKLGAKEGEDSSGISSQAEEYKMGYENRFKSIIEDLLAQSVGNGKVKAYVSIDMNFDRIVTNSEIYDPEGKVARSVQTSEEKELNTEGGAGGSTSVSTNLPQEGGEEGGKNMSKVERTDETTNYEISKTVKNQISETGTIKRLSVAVLVDGNYELNKETKLYQYNPRNTEELKKLENLVKSAVGFKEDRGDKIELINMQFAQELILEKEEDKYSWIKDKVPGLIQALLFSVVALILTIFVFKPLALKAFEVNNANDGEKKDHLAMMTEGEAAADTTEQTIANITEEMVNIDSFENDFKSNQSVKILNDVIEKYPQEAVMLFRKWIAEETN